MAHSSHQLPAPSATPTLVGDVVEAEGVDCPATAHEVAESALAHPTVLLVVVPLEAVGVGDLHDEEVEDGEGLEPDVGGVGGVGEDGREGAVAGEVQQLVVEGVLVAVVEAEPSNYLLS